MFNPIPDEFVDAPSNWMKLLVLVSNLVRSINRRLQEMDLRISALEKK